MQNIFSLNKYNDLYEGLSAKFRWFILWLESSAVFGCYHMNVRSAPQDSISHGKPLEWGF